MVRLKEVYASVVSPKFGFQFHYGTIKRVLRNKSNRLLTYFNSTMVRLKVRLFIHIVNIRVFQFHYGTIKSLIDSVRNDDVLYISIPLWYD